MSKRTLRTLYKKNEVRAPDVSAPNVLALLRFGTITFRHHNVSVSLRFGTIEKRERAWLFSRVPHTDALVGRKKSAQAAHGKREPFL